MFAYLTWLNVGTFVGAVTLAVAGAYVQANDIAPSQIPQVVTKAIQSRFPGAEVIEADVDHDNGIVEYDVDIWHNKKKIDLTLTATGQYLKIEKHLTPAELPTVVSGAVQKVHPQSRLTRVEQKVRFLAGKEQPAMYEIDLRTAQQVPHELYVTAAGQVVHDEIDD